MQEHNASTRDESKENPMRSPRSTHRKHALRKLAAGLLTVLASSLVASADDTALFSTSFPPNVLLMIDNSNSMNEIMRHPGVRRAAVHGLPVRRLQRRAAPREGGTVNDQDGTAEDAPYSCYPGVSCWIDLRQHHRERHRQPDHDRPRHRLHHAEVLRRRRASSTSTGS